MASKKLVVVFGATGNQGGSVINSILEDPATANEFKIRGITRDPSKPNAKALEAKGVETVAADINSKEQVKAAFKGAYAVFAVTNYWEKMDAALEEQQGRNIADAAKVGFSILMVAVIVTNRRLTFSFLLGRRRPASHLVLPLQHQRTLRRQIRQRRALRLQSQHRKVYPLHRHPRNVLHARLLHEQLRGLHPADSSQQRLDPSLAHAPGHPYSMLRCRWRYRKIR